MQVFIPSSKKGRRKIKFRTITKSVSHDKVINMELAKEKCIIGQVTKSKGLNLYFGEAKDISGDVKLAHAFIDTPLKSETEAIAEVVSLMYELYIDIYRDTPL